jgi:hypothetical protein
MIETKIVRHWLEVTQAAAALGMGIKANGGQFELTEPDSASKQTIVARVDSLADAQVMLQGIRIGRGNWVPRS